MLARGFSEFAAELPDDVVTLVYSLTDGEREALGRMRPDQIESVILGSRALAGMAPLATAANLAPAFEPYEDPSVGAVLRPSPGRISPWRLGSPDLLDPETDKGPQRCGPLSFGGG